MWRQRGAVCLAAAIASAAVVACSDDGVLAPADVTPAPTTTTPPPTTTTIAPPTTLEPPFTVESLGRTWQVPAAACGVGTDAVAVMEYETGQAAREVEREAGRQVSGWPTTSAPLPGSREEFEENIAIAGTRALALAELAGIADQIEDRWDEYQQSYADPVAAWGPINTISARIDEWRTPAAELAAAIATACGEGG